MLYGTSEITTAWRNLSCRRSMAAVPVVLNATRKTGTSQSEAVSAAERVVKQIINKQRSK
jgi:hypothetical protein